MPLLGKQFDRRAVIDGADARSAAAKGLIAAGIGEAGDVDAITRAFRERGIQRRGEEAALIWGRVPGRQGRDRIAVTTTLEVREEQRLIETARAGARDRSCALSGKAIAAAVAAFPEIDFTNAHGRAQRRIINQLGTGGRVGVAIGVAGSGKSTLLKPLVRAWQADGRAVHGIALAWRQSDDLAEAGIPAANTRAVAAFLRGMETGAVTLDRKSVVVVDELGLRRGAQSMLLERLMSHRIARVLEERLPGLVAQLHRHGGALVRVARIGADMAEFLAGMVRRQLVRCQSEAEFWRKVGQRTEPVPEQVDRRHQARWRGR